MVTAALLSPPASAAACDPSNSSTCDWTYSKTLYFSTGAISYGKTTPCWFSYDIDLSGKKATTWGESSCDHSAVRMYYGAGSWAGWSSWYYGENTAKFSTAGTPVSSNHKIDPWE